MQTYFGIILNLIIRKKAPEKYMFHGWCFKKKWHWMLKCWDLVVVCPPCQTFWLRTWLHGMTAQDYETIDCSTQARNHLWTPGGAKSFPRGAQIFWTMSKIFKLRPTHFCRGQEFSSAPLVTGLAILRRKQARKTIASKMSNLRETK